MLKKEILLLLRKIKIKVIKLVIEEKNFNGDGKNENAL